MQKRQGEIAQPDQDKEDKDVVYGPKVLVLVPTRELAIQVASQSRQLRSVSGLNTACLYGGVPKETQVSCLTSSPTKAASSGHRTVLICSFLLLMPGAFPPLDAWGLTSF